MELPLGIAPRISVYKTGVILFNYRSVFVINTSEGLFSATPHSNHNFLSEGENHV